MGHGSWAMGCKPLAMGHKPWAIGPWAMGYWTNQSLATLFIWLNISSCSSISSFYYDSQTGTILCLVKNNCYWGVRTVDWRTDEFNVLLNKQTFSSDSSSRSHNLRPSIRGFIDSSGSSLSRALNLQSLLTAANWLLTDWILLCWLTTDWFLKDLSQKDERPLCHRKVWLFL